MVKTGMVKYSSPKCWTFSANATLFTCRTNLKAGSSITVTWHLGYPHRGGYRWQYFKIFFHNILKIFCTRFCNILKIFFTMIFLSPGWIWSSPEKAPARYSLSCNGMIISWWWGHICQTHLICCGITWVYLPACAERFSWMGDRKCKV